MLLKEIFIAIGYHKTGSSWLDRHLFKNPVAGFIWLDNKSLRPHIVDPRSLVFDIAQCREQIQRYFPSRLDDKIPVIGMERLSGHPYSGGYDSKEIADRLVGLFPNARILIVIREQKRIILSTYNQYVRASGPCSLKNYITQYQFRQHKNPVFHLDYFKYNFLIDYYMQLFGRSNVLVLPYEKFQTEPKGYISQIMAFNGIDDYAAMVDALPYDERVNPSLSWITILMMRRLNSLIMKRSPLNPSPLLPFNVCYRRLRKRLRKLESKLPLTILEPCNLAIKRKFMAEITELVGERYQQSNAITSKLIGIDLSQYDYDLPVDYDFSADQQMTSQDWLSL